MAKMEFNTGNRNTDDLSRFRCGSGARESFVLTTVEARRSLPRNRTRRLKGVTQEGESDRFEFSSHRRSGERSLSQLDAPSWT
jgi:hypothetical protein